MSIHDLPPGFKDMLKEFTITVMKKKPKNVQRFAATYFKKLADDLEKAELEEKRSDSCDSSFELSFEDADDVNEVHTGFGARRKTVASERYDPENETPNEALENNPIYPKSPEAFDRLKEKCRRIVICSALDDEQLTTVINAMFERKTTPGETIITQGEEGDNFYVIDSGTYDVFVTVNGTEKKVMEYVDKGSFGELALMYDAPRSATIRATSNGRIYALQRDLFRRIVLRSTFKKRQMMESLLESVPMLKSLSAGERLRLSDALKVRVYEDGEEIIKQGEMGNEMFFIESGEVRFTMKSATGEVKEISRVGKFNYFGELALITRDPRAASAYSVGKVRLAVLEVESFERLLGSCLNLMKRNIDDYKAQVKDIFMN